MTDAMKERLQQSAYQTLIEHTLLSDHILNTNTELVPAKVDYDAFVRLKEIQDTIYNRAISTNERKHLLICSRYTGNGKTSWAVKLLKEYCLQDSYKEYHPYEEEYNFAVFIPTTKYVLCSKEYNEKRRKKYWQMQDAIETAALVVFDDIGSAEYSRAEYVALLDAVDTRIFENQMCIFTSNFIEKNDIVINRLGQRLADRIFDTSEIVELKGIGVRN
jgi:DNA replication protein DnaC